jgi:hypothetical protein
MKVIIYEDDLHGQNLTSQTLNFLRLKGVEVQEAKKFQELKSLLSEDSFTHVIIHHTDFKEVRKLRKEYPNVKYIGYSMIVPPTGTYPSGLDKDFLEKMEENYDESFGQLDILRKEIIIPDYDALLQIFCSNNEGKTSKC